MSDTQNTKIVPVEIFSGEAGKSFMAVPAKCGLKEADTLLISGKRMAAIRDNVILELKLPELTDKALALLKGMVARGEKLAVGEFLSLGNTDAYLLQLKLTD